MRPKPHPNTARSQSSHRKQRDRDQAILGAVHPVDDGAKPVSKIPKILHMVWISIQASSVKPTPLLRKVQLRVDKMRAAHEALGWTVNLWGNELWDMYHGEPFLEAFKRQYPQSNHAAFACDYFRLLLLRDYGGVFTDLDAFLVEGNPNRNRTVAHC